MLKTQPKNQSLNARHVGFAALLIDDLPTWTLERRQPELRSVPVIVAQRGRIVGANALARHCGVHDNDDLHRACALVGVTGQSYRHDANVVSQAWDTAFNQLELTSPRFVSVMPGRALLGDVRIREAQDLAQRLYARVGLAASHSSAWLAANSANPGQARIALDELAFLESIPISRLTSFEVEAATIKRLELLGLTNIAALYQLDQGQLERGFGHRVGQRLYSISRGLERDAIPIQPPTREVSAELELESGVLEPGLLDGAVAVVVQRAVRRLEGCQCAWVRLELQGVVWTRRQRWLPELSQFEKTILRVARALLKPALTGEAVVAVRVILGGLVRPMPVQDNLFVLFDRPKVREAIKRVHERHPNKVGRLEQHRPKAMLPEDRVRFVALTGQETSSKTRKGK
jgi:nucleotidyltransferase/DNA polymerase involved in DNA repair